jgi:hypothetical protein
MTYQLLTGNIMTVKYNYKDDGRYYGIPKDATVVWKPTIYPADKFDYDKIKARVADLKEKGNKQGLETMRRNFERVMADNPGVFDHFAELLK